MISLLNNDDNLEEFAQFFGMTLNKICLSVILNRPINYKIFTVRDLIVGVTK